MFLDEELEQIHNRHDITMPMKKYQMMRMLISRVPLKAEKLGVENFLNMLKQIDNGWRLFQKRHPEYEADFWRTHILRDDEKGKWKKALGW